MNRYDIIILGGGIIGSALAHKLAGLKKRVLILDRGSMGAEASSAWARRLLRPLQESFARKWICPIPELFSSFAKPRASFTLLGFNN
ncbi:MAG: FAD-dependent oxidoreductase [Candidatus Omnitrophica bacterium]|nr:FAD-dependent oxidoreductase [Candidatus Omnitrophota bacterium]